MPIFTKHLVLFAKLSFTECRHRGWAVTESGLKVPRRGFQQMRPLMPTIDQTWWIGPWQQATEQLSPHFADPEWLMLWRSDPHWWAYLLFRILPSLPVRRSHLRETQEAVSTFAPTVLVFQRIFLINCCYYSVPVFVFIWEGNCGESDFYILSLHNYTTVARFWSFDPFHLLCRGELPKDLSVWCASGYQYTFTSTHTHEP